MDTPPPPAYTAGKKKIINHTVKTPFQSIAQPNLFTNTKNYRTENSSFKRIDNRNLLSTKLYQINNNNEHTRFASSTGHKPNAPPTTNAKSLGRTLGGETLIERLSRQLNPTKPSLQPPVRAHSEPTIKYQVSVNDKVYKVLRKLGTGGSAKVYEGFDPQTAQTVAIKIINMAKADSKTQKSYFNEIKLLQDLNDSQGVVKIYDSEYKAKCQELIVVMEKGDADLAQVIDSYYKRKGEKKIDGIFIKYYWREMLLAVNDIHKKGIVHADLKPVNFILVKSQIKLIDFGIAHSIAPDGTSVIRDYQIGTINYMAPETLRNRAEDRNYVNHHQQVGQQSAKKTTVIKYNDKADIWSLGCILYNLVYGHPPFDKFSDLLSKAQAIVDSKHVIDFRPIRNPHLLDCMKACLRYQPEERLSAEQLLRHPYLNEDMTVQ